MDIQQFNELGRGRKEAILSAEVQRCFARFGCPHTIRAGGGRSGESNVGNAHSRDLFGRHIDLSRTVGSFTSIHARSARDALDRLLGNALEAPQARSESLLLRRIASNIDLVVFLEKRPEGRRVTDVIEVEIGRAHV